MSDALARARADLEAGRAWKARDRLAGVLTHRQDDEVLDLLATVYFEMGELPKAGALWHVTGRRDEAARTAVEAWHERYGDDKVRRASIPAVVRRARLGEASTTVGKAARRASAEGWWEPIVFGGGCLVALLIVLAMLVVGVVTTFRWLHG